jgi:hypothetical protein
MFGGKQNLDFQELCGCRSKGPKPVMAPKGADRSDSSQAT